MQIESVRDKLKLLFPVGLWLIWYAAKISIDFNCSADERGSVLTLTSVEAAIDPNYTMVIIAENLGMPIEQILLASKHLPHQSPILVALQPIDQLVASPVQFAAFPLPPAQLPAPLVKIPAPHAAIPA
jgi:hypothetical protein